MEIISLSSPDAKASILEDFDPHMSTWIVPDLVSRTAIQNRLLQKHNLLPSESCLRISDLWRHLLFATRPDIQIISPALTKALTREWLNESEFDWAKTPGASETLVQYMGELMPLLSHPDSQNLMPQWFQENPSAFVRWGLWYLESVRLWKKFESEKMISRQWISGILVNEPGFEKFWQRPLIFDLGVEIMAPEIELMRSLGRFCPVKVLVPAPTWSTEYPTLSRLSNKLNGTVESVKVATLPENRWKAENLEFRRFASSLGEIKDAVSTVREWFDAGTPLEKIAILAPNRKRIWSALKETLKHEGLLVQDSETDPLSAHGRMGQLLARLQTQLGQISTSSLEIDLFHSLQAEKTLMNYDEFNRLFDSIYGPEDLERHSELSQSLKSESASLFWNSSDFMKEIVMHWDSQWATEPLMRLLAEIAKDSAGDLQLAPSNWVNYLAEVMGTLDLPGEKQNRQGLFIENYYSAEHLAVSHVYFLNATDAEFRKSRRTSILEEDLKSLSRVLGFSLVISDPSATEYAAKWLLSKSYEKCVLTYADSDFSGREDAPAFFWLQGCVARGIDHKKIATAGVTVWDQIQEDLAKNPEVRPLGNLLKQEFQGAPALLSEYTGPVRLSATAMANYNKCPYLFYVQNLLRLDSSDVVDFDLGYKDLGHLLHFIMEKLLTLPNGFDISNSEIEALIDSWAKENKFPVVDAGIWKMQKVRLFPYVQKFLEVEKEWRQKFPKTKTVAAEVDFRGSVSTSVGEVQITGRIDRVDADDAENFAVIDYKRASSNLTAPKSWLKNQLYQPLIYTMALENGWTNLGRKNVSTGQYYVLRDGDRSKSYYLSDQVQGLYDCENQQRNKISSDEKVKLLKEMEQVITTTAEGVRSGKFLPKPVDEEDCLSCRWRNSCRARHLM